MAGAACLFAGWIPVAQAAPAAPACARRLLPSAPAGSAPIVTARALVELRDFGRVETGVTGEAPFSVSPDGNWAALMLRQADPDTDSYCMGLMLVALDGGGSARLLATGGEYIPSVNDIWGIPALPNGSAEPVTPVWSPDGRWLAYLRRDRGVTQVWRVALSGAPAEQLTQLASDALELAWTPDGGTILFSTRPALLAGSAGIDREGQSGFLYDRRFWPLSDERPRPQLPIPIDIDAIDLAIRAVRKATPGEVAGWDAKDATRVPGAILYARSDTGASAWTARDNPNLPFSAAPLHVAVGGKMLACPAAICAERVSVLWWRGRSELLFLQSGSPGNGGRLRLYRWRVDIDPAPVRILETADALLGCQRVARALICAREAALEPRTIIRLDPDTGAMRTLFDPNPDYGRMQLGSVERLTWTDKQGVMTYGDLVLPRGHRRGERHPLIVVQYQSRGFLRGGTGDEYPIQLFARHGYAVLSFQRPAQLPRVAGASDLAGVQRINIEDWAERRMIVSVLEAGVDAVIEKGVVDPDRIGLTGLSDGAVTAQFALNHSTRFKAAILSSCCDEPGGAFTAGFAYRDAVTGWGYPHAGSDGTSFWKPMSLAAKAAKFKTPLLIEAADSEYRLALETVSALDDHGAPVELRVFPDEYHVKWHPVHRLAIYERNIAWFDFWLKGLRSDESGRAAEMARWEALRARTDARSS